MINETTPTGDPQPGQAKASDEFREIWRKAPGDFYSPSISMSQDCEAIRVDIAGRVVTLPLAELHAFLWSNRPMVESQGAPSPAPAGEPTRVYRLRELAEDLLWKAIGIAEEPSPKWYKNSDEKIAAIKALKDKWDTDAANSIKSTPAPASPRPSPADPKDLASMDSFIADVCFNSGQYAPDFDAWCESHKALWFRLRALLAAPSLGSWESRARELASWVITESEGTDRQSTALTIALEIAAGAPSAGRPMTWTREAVTDLGHLLDYLDANRDEWMDRVENPGRLEEILQSVRRLRAGLVI